MTVASSVISSFVDPLQGYINEGSNSVAQAVQGPLTAAAALYIVIFGIMILLGYVRAPISDFVINIIRISIIVLIVTEVDTYNTYVTDLFFVQLPEGIGAAVGGMSGGSMDSSSVTSGSAFDEIINRSIQISEDIAAEGSWRDWYPYLVAAFYMALAIIVSMVLLAIYIFGKVALALVLVLGPLFIALLLFRVTQPFFSSWLAAAANFVLLQVLAIALIGMMLSLIQQFIDGAEGAEWYEDFVLAIRLAGLFALTLYLGLQLPSIAARLSGGGLALGGGLAQAAINAAMKVPGTGTAAAALRGGSITPNR